MTNKTFDKGYALIIGVGADLPATINDANALYAMLHDPTRAGYPADHIFLLTDQEATRENILNSFDLLRQKIKSDPGATVMIYYSGHGGIIHNAGSEKEYFLVPFGYDRTRRSTTAISGKEFTKQIEYLNPKKLIVFLDCCHAAGIPMLKSQEETFIPTPIPLELVAALERGTGKVIVASSHENEYSYIRSNQSVFTHCLLEALSGKGTRGEDGFVHILETLIYLFKQVPLQAPGGSQHPYIKKILDLGDNFPICWASLDQKGEIEEAPTISYTVHQRKRGEQQLMTLQQEWDLRIAKIKRIREALAVETDISAIFKLEHLVLQEESALASLGVKIEQLEQSMSR